MTSNQTTVRIRLQLALGIVAVLAVPAFGFAEPLTIGEYQASLKNPHLNDATHAYVDGMVDGMRSMMSGDAAPAFCDIENKLSSDTFDVNLLNNWIAVNNPPVTDNVNEDFLLAIKETFPCS